jgi:hypothetical protein
MTKKIIDIAASSIFLFCIFILLPACSSQHGDRKDETSDEQKTNTTLVGTQMCKKCHMKIDTLIVSGSHKNLSCETCHGGGSVHISDPIVYKMVVPSGRKDCATCHANNSKSADIKQIDIAKHNVGSKCVKCHNPHQTGFGWIAGNNKRIDNSSVCSMCHAKINKVRMGGVHKVVECESCHAGWEKHLDNPRATKPQKSSERAFCGKCHSKELAPHSTKIKQVDLKEHNTESKCTECHNPHSPWE